MPGWQPSKLRKAIPRGKTRIIGIDLFAFEEYLVKDCDTPAEAIEIADRNNESRKNSIDDVYYVYDDHGHYIHGVNPETGLVDSPQIGRSD